MKLKNYVLLFCLICLLTGCAPFSPKPEQEPVENKTHLTMGSSLEVKNTDNRLVLIDDNSALAADGLYYASWGIGNAQPYKNKDGNIVDLYDASLYLLMGEAKTNEAAKDYMNTWLEAAKTNYDILEEKEMTFQKQAYTVVAYQCRSEDNPCARGISAFAAFGNSAVCAELTCQNDFKDDLESILENFLNHCSYISNE